MDCAILVNFALLATFGSPVAGKLLVKPRDADAKVNQSTYFNCSTDHGSTAIFWFHGAKRVYTGISILEPYHERFRVDRYVWNGTNISNLVIHSVQPGDAGEYTCAEDEGVGEKYSIQLIVLDGDPICRSNIELDKVIGQNTCNVEPDEVELSCSVIYHGNIHPQLEWKKSGDYKKISKGLYNVTSANHYNYILKLKGDISLGKSSYVCETTRTAHEPRTCISKVINVLYALSDNPTVNRTINDEIRCHANTTQSCSYLWRWFQNNDVTTESSSEILKPRKSGLHKCEAECYLRNETCNLPVMRAMVYGESNRRMMFIIIYVAAALFVVGILIFVGLWIVRKGGAAGCQLKSCLLPIITNQVMADKLASMRYYIDTGESGQIYGPFKWQDKICAMRRLLHKQDSVTEERKAEITQLRNNCMKLDHVHIAQVFEVWFPSPALYILMEYAEGSSLDRILRPKDNPTPLTPFSNDVVQNWALQIADGMKYLHEKQLVHRKLKPANVLLMKPFDSRNPCTKLTLKIADFLEVKEVKDCAIELPLVGMFAYMAPEVLEHRQFSTASDVWSFGVVIWEMLSRDIPHKGLEENAIMSRSINGTLDNLRIELSFPEDYKKLLNGCWESTYTKRVSFQEISNTLRQL